MYSKMDVWQSRAARLIVIVILCVHPLYVSPKRYLGLTGEKYRFFVAFMCVALLAVLIIWIARMTRKPRLLPRSKLQFADYAILGFAAVTIISAILSPYKGDMNVWSGFEERFDGAITQLLYISAFFAVSRWYKPRAQDLALFGISAILVALIGILQFYGMDIFKLWPNHLASYYRENFFHIHFRTTLGNTNIVSTYVCVAMLLSGFLFVRAESKWRPLWLSASALNFWLMELADADSGRIGLLVTMVMAIPFIIETRKSFGRTLILASSWIATYTLQKLFYEAIILHSRTAGSLLKFALAAALLLAVGVLLTRRGKGRSSGGNTKWKLGVALIAVCIIGGFAGIEVLGRQDPEAGDTNIIYELREIIHGRVRDEFATYRIYIWRNALEMFPKNPIIGSGPDTFYHAFPEEAQGIVDEDYENAHNEYIQILICQGILGLACYLAFIMALLLKSIPKAFKNPMIMAVLAAFFGYCVQAFFNLSVPIVTPMLWIFAGMLASKKVRETAMEETGPIAQGSGVLY